jgi:hypothetical protein
MRERRPDQAGGLRCSSCGHGIDRCAICGMHACSRPLCESCFLEQSGIPDSIRADFLEHTRAFQEGLSGEHP